MDQETRTRILSSTCPTCSALPGAQCRIPAATGTEAVAYFHAGRTRGR